MLRFRLVALVTVVALAAISWPVSAQPACCCKGLDCPCVETAVIACCRTSNPPVSNEARLPETPSLGRDAGKPVLLPSPLSVQTLSLSSPRLVAESPPHGYRQHELTILLSTLLI
jgi:hypothetical protein